MKLPLWLGSLICLFAGHLRGRRLPQSPLNDPQYSTFRCDRCGQEWTRKIYPRIRKPLGGS